MDLSLELNPNAPNYGDLKLIAGDLVLTSDSDKRGTPYVLQSCLQRLQMQRGEWFLNKTLGVPYAQAFFKKNFDRSFVENTIRGVILGTPGVLALTSFNSVFTTANRLLRISFGAETVAGPISYTGPLNTPANLVTQ